MLIAGFLLINRELNATKMA